MGSMHVVSANALDAVQKKSETETKILVTRTV